MSLPKRNIALSSSSMALPKPGEDLEGRGGYAIVFNRYRPGTKKYGVGLAWPMEIAVTPTSAEVTAVLETMVQVHSQITEIFTSGEV